MVALTGLNGTGTAQVSLGFLVGDVTGNGALNAGDFTATKARVGRMVGATTYRYDLNGSGVISGLGLSMVKARAGMVLP